MWRAQGLQADHSRPRAIAGPHRLADRLVHGWCNSSAGASLGNAIRAHSKPDTTGLSMPWP